MFHSTRMASLVKGSSRPPRTSDEVLDALLHLTARLTEPLALEAYLQHVTDTALYMLDGDHASLRLLDADALRLLSSARSGVGKDGPPVEFRVRQGLLGWVIEHGESVRIDDVELDARFQPNMAQPYSIRSIILEPVWSGGQVTGVLSVSSPKVAAFDELDQLRLRLLANCSSPAIEKARLERLALFDQQTLAFAHHYLRPRLDEELERSRRSRTPLSVLLMDLDHFKSVNDTFGHAAGDDALKQFGDLVRAQVRRVDVFVRRGGEEFVLIMPSTDETEADATAARIRKLLEATPMEFSTGRKHVQTVSIGVATWDGHESAESLEARADAAMYEAKRAGRNRVVTSSMPPK
ncbi:MAG: sensor domain-containing diguanylate cyclase [Polyangiaceae bacterium]